MTERMNGKAAPHQIARACGSTLTAGTSIKAMRTGPRKQTVPAPQTIQRESPMAREKPMPMPWTDYWAKERRLTPISTRNPTEGGIRKSLPNRKPGLQPKPLNGNVKPNAKPKPPNINVKPNAEAEAAEHKRPSPTGRHSRSWLNARTTAAGAGNRRRSMGGYCRWIPQRERRGRNRRGRCRAPDSAGRAPSSDARLPE